MSDLARWYVVHTYSGYENKVATNLEKIVENRKLHDWIHEIRVPTETVVEIKDNKKREVERKIFPGYVLVKMVMTDDSWYVVRNTRGCTGFVGPNGKPIPLTEEEVAALGVEKRPRPWRHSPAAVCATTAAAHDLPASLFHLPILIVMHGELPCTKNSRSACCNSAERYLRYKNNIIRAG